MLHVVLLILKILGILLLSVLGLLILLLGAVLFMPVTYGMDAEKQEQIRVSARAGWFFRFLFIKYEMCWPEEGTLRQDLCIRILGIPVFRPFREKKKKRKETEPEHAAEKPQTRKAEPGKAEPTEPEVPEPEPDQSGEKPPIEEGPTPENRPEPEHKTGEKEAVSSLWKRIRHFFRRAANRIKNMGNSVRNLGESIRKAGEKKDAWLEFWNLEEHVQARAALLKEASYLWKRSRPRKVKGTLHFGLWDPAATGIFMGMLSLLYAWYPEDFLLDPDFDQIILKGELHIRGHIQLYPFCLSAWRTWRNREVRLMYKHWKHK